MKDSKIWIAVVAVVVAVVVIAKFMKTDKTLKPQPEIPAVVGNDEQKSVADLDTGTAGGRDTASPPANPGLGNTATSRPDQPSTSEQTNQPAGLDPGVGSGPDIADSTEITPGSIPAMEGGSPSINSPTAPEAKDGKVMSVPNALKDAKREVREEAEARKKRAKAENKAATANDALNSAGRGAQEPPSPQTATAATPIVPVPEVSKEKQFSASVPEESCDVQWTKHVGVFKPGSDMVYMTSMSVQRPLASDIATSHTETVKQSSGKAVVRDIGFSSDHPTGTLVLMTIGTAPSISTSKEAFVASCRAAGGRAVGSVLFKVVRLKLKDVTDTQIKVGSGTYKAYRMKLDAALQIRGKTVTANVDVWMAKNKPGLIVRQTIKIPASAFPEHGAISMTTQLAGGKI